MVIFKDLLRQILFSRTIFKYFFKPELATDIKVQCTGNLLFPKSVQHNITWYLQLFGCILIYLVFCNIVTDCVLLL